MNKGPIKRGILKKKNSYRTELNKAMKKPSFSQKDYTVKWLNPFGVQCKVMHKTNGCFCGHELNSHVYHESNSLHCTSLGCKCVNYQYLPVISLQCICKHSYLKHTKQHKKCEKCVNCLGFATNWSCKCGYRYLCHNNHIEFKENNQKNSQTCATLPTLSKNHSESRFKKTDRILQDLNLSTVKSKIIERQSSALSSQLSNEQKSRQAYLHDKLKEANKRYFSKFQQKQLEQQPKQHQQNALDLYLKPHMYTNVPLNNFIHKTLLR